jgi:hypothetical protein
VVSICLLPLFVTCNAPARRFTNRKQPLAMDAPTEAARSHPQTVACPYCARPMRWCSDGRRPGSGCFECEHCGTFDVPGLPADLRLNVEHCRQCDELFSHFDRRWR